MASILIIDDSSFMRGKLRAMLKRENYIIEEAHDGFKGLQLASTRNFDLILLDIIMPGIDGFKILGALRGNTKAPPVIVITADIQESVHRQCMELGAAEVLYKLPKEQELIDSVKRVLGKTGVTQG